MSSTASSDWSYSESPTASCSSSGGRPTQWRPNNDLAVQKSDSYIEILEKPQTHARLRYPSEGDHGYLYGVNSTRDHTTYPTVRLVNYDGEAHIRCEVYQFDREEVHPHLLQYDKREERSQIDFLVPSRGSYTVCYDKLSFVRKSIDRVTEEEKMKYRSTHPNATDKQVTKCCKKIVKGIDMNRVRLRFSAHDVNTGDEICYAYSNPILDKKNPDTNELRINRVSHLAGEPGDEIILLVTKINSNDCLEMATVSNSEYNVVQDDDQDLVVYLEESVKVRFVDPNAECGEWCPFAYMKQVHHQVAIVCRVPEYKERDLSSDVEVFIELVRSEKNGEYVTSNSVPFIYKRQQKQRHLAMCPKKRSFQTDVTENSPQYCMGCKAKIKKNSDEDIKNGPQVCEVPVSFEIWSTDDDAVHPSHSPQAFSEPIQGHQRLDSNGTSSASNSDSGVDIAQAQDISFDDIQEDFFKAQSIISEEVNVPRNLLDVDETVLINNPVLGQTSAVVPPTVAHLNINHQSHDEDSTQFNRDFDISEYMEDIMDVDSPFQSQLISDSPRIKLCSFSNENTAQNKMSMKSENTYKSGKISICEISEVDKMKELLKDIIAIKKKGSKKNLQTKVEQLYDLDLPNGDTFQHVSMNRAVTFFFANVLHAMKMAHLLNRTNDLNQTVLHLAVLNKCPDFARMLVSKGADPMLADIDGNNAIHQAVMSYKTLQALLEASSAYKVTYDINATNNENQTPLHVAAINDCESSLRLLLERGADTRAVDYSGRTALHMAACHDRAEIVRALLDYMDPEDVDATDLRGQTALQIACDSDVRENTLSIIQLLLIAKANPTKCDSNSVSALNLAKRHPEMFKVIQRHMVSEDGSDDEYFTGDEGESEDEYNIVSMLHAITINGAK